MPDAAIASAIAQFGAAGLIAAMWLLERRAAAQRDSQLAEAHRRIHEDRVALETVLAALDRSTRALAAVESGQQRLATAIERMTTAARRRARSAPVPAQRRAALRRRAPAA